MRSHTRGHANFGAPAVNSGPDERSSGPLALRGLFFAWLRASASAKPAHTAFTRRAPRGVKEHATRRSGRHSCSLFCPRGREKPRAFSSGGPSRGTEPLTFNWPPASKWTERGRGAAMARRALLITGSADAATRQQACRSRGLRRGCGSRTERPHARRPAMPSCRAGLMRRLLACGTKPQPP